ncbi:histidine phosphatase family protein [Actinomyces sp. oral taxon 897]|uniref:histidine phosphatase family protein n=1 Tax=Actinomyces sp. oral taxon 897 TaxID=2081702 RepID=UPI000D02CF7F|nr:histidine phosphatase family protein [Actinomyces sp. oral taxon 897]AVM61879.1 histidine phosphatase family protein [Actinomyces sp. oral taxon 897]
MVRTTIHVMRHGEVYNPEGILYGRRPGYHLSALGAAMAQRVAHVLSATGHDVVAVITSPLERARESGAPTAEAFGLTPTTDVRLTEAGNHFEGVPVNRDRRVLTHPQHWRYYVNPLRPSWGEPYVDLVARMAAAVRDAVPLAQGHEALLVSHQLPIWSLRLWLEGRLLAHDPRRRQCSLASLTSLTFEDRTLTGLAYWEPAGDLLRQAEDMVPGTSAASEKMGDAGAATPAAHDAAPAAPAGPETGAATPAAHDAAPAAPAGPGSTEARA